MPLVASEMKQKFQKRIHDGLKRVFGADKAAEPSWVKMADAISDIAMDIVMELQTNASIAPGQQVVTAGSAAAQTGTTVSPGKIL